MCNIFKKFLFYKVSHQQTEEQKSFFFAIVKPGSVCVCVGWTGQQKKEPEGKQAQLRLKYKLRKICLRLQVSPIRPIEPATPPRRCITHDKSRNNVKYLHSICHGVSTSFLSEMINVLDEEDNLGDPPPNPPTPHLHRGPPQ